MDVLIFYPVAFFQDIRFLKLKKKIKVNDIDTKYWRSGVRTPDLSSRRLLKVGDLQHCSDLSVDKFLTVNFLIFLFYFLVFSCVVVSEN